MIMSTHGKPAEQRGKALPPRPGLVAGGRLAPSGRNLRAPPPSVRLKIERLIPSVAAAPVAGRRVRVPGSTRVFALGPAPAGPRNPPWAWPAATDPCRFWHAEGRRPHAALPRRSERAGRVGRAMTESTDTARSNRTVRNLPEQTLVMASCDPGFGTSGGRRWLGRHPIVFSCCRVPARKALRLLGQKFCARRPACTWGKAGQRRG